MKILNQSYQKLLISLCIFCLILASFPPAPAVAAGPEEPDLSNYIVDQFNAETLASHWSIIKPNPANWSLTSNEGFMTIHTTKTDIYQTDNSQDNVFLSNLVNANDNFEIVLKVEAEVVENHQQAGLIVWQDADNFVKLSHVYDNGSVLESAYELNAKYMKPINPTVPVDSHTQILKIRKVGNQYTTYYWNGDYWAQAAAGAITANLSNVKVGFYANNVVSNQRIHAKFDYFAVRKLTEGVDLEPAELDLKIGETAQLINVAEGNASLNWESSDTNIATVSANGLVTAIGSGRAIITAATVSGDFSDKVFVTVTDPNATGVLYEEDFEGELEGWTTYGGNWTLANGQYNVDSGAGNKAVLDNIDFTDFVFEADVKITSGDQAGLIFRVSEPGVGADKLEGYYVGINAKTKQALLGYFTNNTWKEIASRNLPINYDQAYPIKVIVNKGHIQAYIGDNPLNEQPYPKFDLLYDKHLTSGKIGFRTHFAVASFDNIRVSAYEETVTGATYTNSIMPNIADPHVLYHEGIYYLYGTHTPDWPTMVNGIKVYTSTDLVNWEEQPGWALHRDDSWGEKQFWAPEVIERNGTFYMYYAVEEHLAVATSDSPLGPFKQEVKQPMSNIREIDAHIFTDDDGKTYIYLVRFTDGNALWVAEMNDDMLTYDESTMKPVFAATQPWENSTKAPRAKVNEGPFIVKHNGTYYMTYSGNHFESPDYGVGYATADSPLGPWEKYEYNPIMKSNLVMPGAGHHSMIYTADKSELFMVYHMHNDIGVTEPRKLGIDRVQFVPNPNGGPDIMEVWGPTLTPQPMPKNGNEQEPGEEPEPEQHAASIAGAVQAEVDSDVALVYSLNNFTDSRFATIYAQDVTVQYDPAHLTFKDVASLRDNKLIVSAEEQAPGEIRLLVASKGEALDINGQWLQLNFTAKASTTSNTTVTLSDIVVANKTGLELEIEDAAHALKITAKNIPDPGPGPSPDPGPGSDPGPVTPPTEGSGGEVVIKDGKVTVKLDEKNSTKSIPVEQLKDAALELKTAGSSLNISAESLAELLKQAGTNNLQGTTVEVSVTGAASSTLQAPVAGSPTEAKQASLAYQFALQLKAADGSIIVLKDAPAAMELTLDYTSGFDRELLGIYRYNEATNVWQYVGGVMNQTALQITTTVDQFGTYAVFEFKKAFDDVAANHWAARALQVLAAKHVVNGTSETNFTPNGKTTRAEFTAMLVRILGLSKATATAPFSDVASGKWYADDIAAAYEAGLIQGVSAQQFAPDANITREQMAALLVRAYEKLHGGINVNGTEYTAFADSTKVSGWAQVEISKAIATGLMQGKDKDMFDPGNNALRAETAQAMYNLLQAQ
ncbi:MAG TPA: family 43 glycosylhydrolase [Candidatus Paenibacillus intestinavium]|nr:family 43 glycosylhydrolase [Candidatus Paenibacillus intestinavium]